MTDKHCFFCDWSHKEGHKIMFETDYYIVHYDDFPVSPGHCEISPKKHIESFFDLDEKMILELHNTIKLTKEKIDAEFHPDGYNIGINEGEAAGRTIHHFHLHLIPRYNGDVQNPRGGVRHIIPEKGFYQIPKYYEN